MRNILFSMILSAGGFFFLIGCNSQPETPEQPTLNESETTDKAATPAVASTPEPVATPDKIGEQLAGKLLKVTDESVTEFTIDKTPKHYVFYHSASW